MSLSISQALIKLQFSSKELKRRKIQRYMLCDLSTHEICMEFPILTAQWYNEMRITANAHSPMKMYPILPSIIDENVFVGAKITSINVSVLKALKIGAILNVTPSVPFPIDSHSQVKFRTMRIPVSDHPSEDISAYFESALKWIYECIQQKTCNRKVLIHCEKGQSRSISIAIVYFMNQYCMTLTQALQQIKQRRKGACPNQGFIKQLQRYSSLKQQQRHK